MGSIDLDNHSLFAPAEIAAKDFGWALAMVNGAHFRTRRSYLLNELPFEEGDCFDEAELANAVRNIRDLDFIARVTAESVPLGDSTVAVHVQTWDEWSTGGGADFDIENSFQFKGFTLSEKNAFGRGLRASFRYRSFRERRDKSFTLGSVRFLGTRALASVSGGTTRTGEYWRLDSSQPYLSEAGSFAYQNRMTLEDREYAYLTGAREGVTHALLPLYDKTWYAFAQKRIGVAGDLKIVGGEFDVVRRDVTGPIRQVEDFDFVAATTASAEFAARVAPQDTPDSWVRLGASVGLRQVRFTTATGLDLISGVQNVTLGKELILTVGRTLYTWGTTSTDSYAELDGFAQGQWGPVLAQVSGVAWGRMRDYAPTDGSRWRDLSLRGRAFLYWQPPPTGVHTAVLGVRYDLRGNVDQLWQMPLGGEDGVRGYQEDELPTSSLVVMYAEERINLPWFKPAVDLGLSATADLGRGWAADVPFGQDTGWRASVGGGLRIGFPAGTGTVTRIEVTWPVGPAASGKGPVLRTYWSPVRTRR